MATCDLARESLTEETDLHLAKADVFEEDVMMGVRLEVHAGGLGGCALAQKENVWENIPQKFWSLGMQSAKDEQFDVPDLDPDPLPAEPPNHEHVDDENGQRADLLLTCLSVLQRVSIPPIARAPRVQEEKAPRLPVDCARQQASKCAVLVVSRPSSHQDGTSRPGNSSVRSTEDRSRRCGFSNQIPDKP